MLPGHDTTASALAWTLYSLAEHPHFQRQCQQEIDSLLLGRNTDDITWSVAQTLPVNVCVCVLEELPSFCLRTEIAESRIIDRCLAVSFQPT